MKEMWIARDEDGLLYLFFKKKPQKGKTYWDQNDDWIEIDNHLFPEIKWSDKEPTKVKLVIDK